MKGFSLHTQEEMLIQYTREHGYKIVGIYQKEDTTSGNRPQNEARICLYLV